jgi:hypothetical protein
MANLAIDCSFESARCSSHDRVMTWKRKVRLPSFSMSATAIILGVAMSPAHGVVAGTCTINVTSQGTMVASPGLSGLSSKLFGGSFAMATVTSNGLACGLLDPLTCFSISTQAPVSFSQAPSGGSANVNFVSSFTVDGGAESPTGSPQTVANGAHAVRVHLVAIKSTNVFPAGTYRARVTLRCE